MKQLDKIILSFGQRINKLFFVQLRLESSEVIAFAFLIRNIYKKINSNKISNSVICLTLTIAEENIVQSNQLLYLVVFIVISIENPKNSALL